jgi:hypothetical protein
MIEDKFNELKKNKLVKAAFYLGIGILSFYVIGKTFNCMATTIRAFNNFKSAVKGN